MKIYAVTKVCSNGFASGKESFTFIKKDFQELVQEVYEDYCYEVKNAIQNEEFFDKKLLYVEFQELLIGEEIPVIQCKDFHVQYEPWSFFIEEEVL